ncbi:MAG: competence/damage-inducible protein A [Acidobacteria bacterium]|nr:competence/damage-inducible protein A [Acidobacteriota bacterium]MCA1649476.1 competence/damage-inducible protein A [Acidobacteriota bacterium]
MARVTAPGRPLRTAEVIAVGSELLGTTRLDTNSLFLADRLASLGIVLRAKAVVGDSREDLSALFSQALGRSDLVITTGGLGPTDDDLTRDVVAAALSLPLEEDAAIVARIAERFARRGLHMPEVNRRQAMVPAGAVVLNNPNGTAPGLFIDHGDRVVVLLPGPPRELQPMMDGLVVGALAERASAERLFRTTLAVTGRSESHVEEAIQPIYSAWRDAKPSIDTTILAVPGQIELHLTLRSSDETHARQTLANARDALMTALGDDVFSSDGRAMEEVVGDLLRARDLTVAVAESCTGGLLTSRLTDVPGSSAYVLAGVAAYSNTAKTELVGVPASLLEAHGAVSEPVAEALARGIMARTGADVGVGVTGIAGPGGATPGKPVGTVAIAVARGAESAITRTFRFPGGRAQVKYSATQAALDMLRRLLSQ